MALNPALSGAIHDLQARLGSIRIAVTAVAGLDLDPETRNAMLTTASDESVRASAELAAIGALAACALDNSGMDHCDLLAALHDAAAKARLAGLDVAVSGGGAAVATARPERVRVAFPALIRLVAGAGKQVRASANTEAGRVHVRVERHGPHADTDALAPVVDHLVAALDAVRALDDDALTFSFEGSA